MPVGVKFRVFVRLFFVQACWNTRSMMGHGFAFALLPVLRWLHPNPEALRESLARHVVQFNAHPYLAALGIGAVARLEADGRPVGEIAHFKTAIRGPLGGLGDRLVWAGWLPAISLAALAAAILGTSPEVSVILFLFVFNVGHLGLRAWSLSAGYDAGFDLAGRLKSARLDRKADATGRMAGFFLGLVVGLVLMRGVEAGLVRWIPLGVLFFLGGNLARGRTWRPAVLATASLIAFLTIAGALL